MQFQKKSPEILKFRIWKSQRKKIVEKNPSEKKIFLKNSISEKISRNFEISKNLRIFQILKINFQYIGN